ncbi:MAG TPA: glycoside hydrolase N-terminal domain-containing protein [Microbacterium sp.]|nr:glycoside hydrolase N-terminal domain-containing protein [Microbacterium sp.]
MPDHSAGDLRFTTRTPAVTWEDGLIVGSGRVGAVVHGAPDRLLISLAHERFFLPANPRPDAPDLRDVLAEMRAGLLAGDGAVAAGALGRAAHDAGYDGLVWTDPLGMCATLSLVTPGGVASFSRTTDLARGVVTVAWQDDAGSRHRVHVVAPRGTDSVRVAVESDAATRAEVRMGLDDVADDQAASFAPDYSGAVEAAVRAGDAGRLEVRDHDGHVLAQVHARSDAPWSRSAGAEALTTVLEIPAEGRRMLRFDLSVAGHPMLPAPEADWATILREQTAAHHDLVTRSLLDLGGAPVEINDIADLWASAYAGDPAARRRAIEIAYASGRAHIIASTGELPPTLQGVWQGTWKPAWSADYTLNGNVQNGAMAAMIPTGTPELARSLLELVLPYLDDYRDNARLIYDADGMLLPSRMSTHGRASHFNADFPHLFWVGCGGWVLRVAADIVSATGDASLVDDRLWALVEGVLRFGETATVVRDGVRHLIPSYSPENTPSGAASPLASDSTIDIAILRDAARAGRLLGRARGDDSLDARWEALAAALPDYGIADDGTLAEWGDGWAQNGAHRHLSQLYPLWYEIDAAFMGDDACARALRAAAQETIRTRIAWRADDPTPPPGRMEMAFGLVQLGLAAAALGDADSALICAEWLAVDHWSPALTSRHDAGRIFNLDASGGLPAVVAAMLLSSAVDTLTVLPALPDAWSSGAITGLRGRGGIVVDRLAWDDAGCTIEVRRLAEAAWLNPEGRMLVRCPRAFTVEGGPERVLRAGESTLLRLRWVTDAPASSHPSARTLEG